MKKQLATVALCAVLSLGAGYGGGVMGSHSVTGPRGAIGAAGRIGAQGPQGEAGVAGPVGAIGAQGTTGATGANGTECDTWTFASDGNAVCIGLTQ